MLARTERHVDRVADDTSVTERNYTDARGVTQVRILTVEGGAMPARSAAPTGAAKRARSTRHRKCCASSPNI